jgi:hypothetical protein
MVKIRSNIMVSTLQARNLIDSTGSMVAYENRYGIKKTAPPIRINKARLFVLWFLALSKLFTSGGDPLKVLLIQKNYAVF